ncbi:Hypothetical_protein [Hexamita inflata]|uniref:Hypothetical_protein n=1 Tax=Hexamita inflata TaxID=28002 RepID=A0AA86QJG5_9EUKA|nr:Hypothetical protein HINF_LOCUS48216 [Hexamita inflata]
MTTPTIPKSPADLQLYVLKRQLEQTKNDLDRVNNLLIEETKQATTLRLQNADLYEQIMAQINAVPQVSAEDLQALKQQNDILQAKIDEYEEIVKRSQNQTLKDQEFEAKIMQALQVAEKAKVIDKIELIIQQNSLLQQLIPKKEEMERIWAVQNQLGKLIQVKEKPTEQDRAKFIQTLRKELKTCYRIDCATEEEVIIEAQKKGTDQFWKNMDIEMTNSRKYFDRIVNAAKGESK